MQTTKATESGGDSLIAALVAADLIHHTEPTAPGGSLCRNCGTVWNADGSVRKYGHGVDLCGNISRLGFLRWQARQQADAALRDRVFQEMRMEVQS